MAGIFDRKFSGEIPKLTPVNLPEGSAQQAINCDLRSGYLQPYPDDTAVVSRYPTTTTTTTNIPIIKGLYHHVASNLLVCSPYKTHVTKHTTNGAGRILFSDGVHPKATKVTQVTRNGASPLALARSSNDVTTGEDSTVNSDDKYANDYDSGFLGVDKPSVTPLIKGDVALSSAYLDGTDHKQSTSDKYTILSYAAPMDAKGVVGDFVAIGSVTTQDPLGSGRLKIGQFASDWQSDPLFTNKYREYSGTAIFALTATDVVLAFKIYKTINVAAVGAVAATTKDVTLAIVYSPNFPGTGSGIGFVGETPPPAPTAAPSTRTYPTVKGMDFLDALSDDELTVRAAETQPYWTGDGESGGGYTTVSTQTALAAQAVLVARKTLSESTEFTDIYPNNAKKRSFQSKSQYPISPPYTATQQVASTTGSGATTAPSTATTSTNTSGLGHTVKLSLFTTLAETIQATAATTTPLAAAKPGYKKFSVSGTLIIGELDTRSYCYTFVNKNMEESEPSKPSTLITVDQGHCVRVVVARPTEGHSIRIYRSVTGSSASDYFFFREITQTELKYVVATADLQVLALEDPLLSAANILWLDGKSNMQAGEALSTVGDVPPPNDITHLQSYGEGMLAAISGDTLLISKWGRPYAWPHPQRTTATDTLLAAKVMGNGILLGSDMGFVMASGSSPTSMTLHKLPSSATLIHNEFVNVGDKLLAATTEGLAFIDGASVDTALSESLWTVELWEQAWNSFHGGRIVSIEFHNNQIILFGEKHAYVLSVSTGTLSRLTYNSSTTLNYDDYPETDRKYPSRRDIASASTYSAKLNTVYWADKVDFFNVAAVKTESVAVRKLFGGGDNEGAYSLQGDTDWRSMTYISRVFRFKKHLSLGVVKLVLDPNFPVLASVVIAAAASTVNSARPKHYGTFQLFGIGPSDTAGTAITEELPIYPYKGAEQVFRIPGGRLYSMYYYAIKGKITVMEVNITETMQELQNY